MIWFLVGAFIGAAVGWLALSLAAAASSGDDALDDLTRARRERQREIRDQAARAERDFRDGS